MKPTELGKQVTGPKSMNMCKLWSGGHITKICEPTNYANHDFQKFRLMSNITNQTDRLCTPCSSSPSHGLHSPVELEQRAQKTGGIHRNPMAIFLQTPARRPDPVWQPSQAWIDISNTDVAVANSEEQDPRRAKLHMHTKSQTRFLRSSRTIHGSLMSRIQPKPTMWKRQTFALHVLDFWML